MPRNQAIPRHEADRIILFYAPNIESDIDSLLDDRLIGSQAEYTATARRIAKFLNAVLCNGGVVPPTPNLVCHHTTDEWEHVPCPSCPKENE